MIQRFFVVRCDKCHRRYNWEFDPKYATSSEALRDVTRMGWARGKGNLVYCDTCKEADQ